MQVRFYNSAGSFYFMKNDYEESLQWVAKSSALINQHGIFPDYKFFCQTLELIAHYELGNFQYLESALRNFNRSIGKGNKNGLEYLAVKTIGKLVKAVDRSEKDFIAADFYSLLRQKTSTETLQSKVKKNLLQHWISQHLILQNHEQFN